jgi:hypothetical protein
MRRLKPTPLLIVSLGLIIYGFYLLFFVDPGEEGWGTLFAMVAGGVGIAGLIIYAIFRITLKKRVWLQVGIETFLIAGLLYIGYRKSGIYEFHLPHNYRGYIMVVYGVENAPKLKTPFYSNKIKFTVTASGIILTSSLPNDNYSDPAVFLDSTLGEINTLPRPYTRHDIPYSTDTLKCDDKNYLLDMWLIKDEPNWMKKEDTLNRLDLKLIEACTLIRH